MAYLGEKKRPRNLHIAPELGRIMGNGQNRLRPEALGELSENTDFSEDEIRKWYKEFLTDFPDGQLSIDQFKDIYVQHFPNGDATKFAEHVFRTFDTDNNKNLDFREFMCALSITARGGPKDRLRWAFQMYDVDENGYISKKECMEIVRAIYNLRSGESPSDTLLLSEKERVDQVFRNVDQDNDGLISEDELVDGVRMDDYLVRILQFDQVRF